MPRLDGGEPWWGGSVLRPYCQTDIDALGKLRSDEETQHLLLSHPERSSGDLSAWIDRRQRDVDGFFAVVTAPDDYAAVGFVQLTSVHRIDRYAMGGIAVLPSHRRVGIGRRAMSALMMVAQSDYGLRKLMLQVRSDNIAALRLYASLGFDQVGTLRSHYNDGSRLHDVVLLESFLFNQALE